MGQPIEDTILTGLNRNSIQKGKYNLIQIGPIDSNPREPVVGIVGSWSSLAESVTLDTLWNIHDGILLIDTC